VFRRVARKTTPRSALIVTCFILLAGIIVYKQAMPTNVDPTAYTPILNTIARGESKGNYNAYFGNVTNSTVRFTEMPVAAVLQWQEAYVQQGSPSSAVGKYQIVRPTLAGLVQQLGIDPQTRFDEALQDRMAIALLERRGALDYVDKKLTREQFAANLAKEWAALPRVIGDDPAESYYAHDGLNKSQISPDEIFNALAMLERQTARR